MQKTRTEKIKKAKLPESFRYLMWSYRFDKIDPIKDKEVLIVNTINYGQWFHWQWLTRCLGKDRVRRVIENLAASEFRPSALSLAQTLFGIKKMKYALRSDKIKAARNS